MKYLRTVKFTVEMDFLLKFLCLLPLVSDASAMKFDSRFNDDYYARSILRTRRGILRLGTCHSVTYRHCSNSSINFVLYTQHNASHGESLQIRETLSESNLLEKKFDASRPTKIIIHGYNSDMFLDDLMDIKNEYLNGNHSVNVIFVDWSELSKGPCYPGVVWNTRFAGKCTAELVDVIRKAGNAEVHLIGFSLGAHVAGFTADNVKSGEISRITGLDPAWPGFPFMGTKKLDPDDAKFVDIIHTNALLQGTVQECGHIDFYVNGGTLQAGCGIDIFACNHHRAPKYFAESINSEVGFWGWHCSSYISNTVGLCSPAKPKALMGETADRSIRGVFFVNTNSEAPFAMGVYSS